MRLGLPLLPQHMKRLPIEERGYPVPWFVEWVEGKPDFRIMDGRKLVRAVKEHLCWLCGQVLGAYKTFVMGPMCAVNRVSAEPPSHRDCAEFAVRSCPFLMRPKAERREATLPETAISPAGIMISRNPGVTLLWITKTYHPFDAGNGLLFRVGDPEETMWFCEGRLANREEVLASFKTGLPILREMAEQDGPEACGELELLIGKAMRFVPPSAEAREG